MKNPLKKSPLKLSWLFLILLTCQLAFGQTQNQADQSSHPLLPKKLQHISYAGSDGTSCEKAVIINKAANSSEGIFAERAWIKWKYPGAKIKTQAFSGKNKRYFDVFAIETSGGETKTVCFDITDFFGT